MRDSDSVNGERIRQIWFDLICKLTLSLAKQGQVYQRESMGLCISLKTIGIVAMTLPRQLLSSCDASESDLSLECHSDMNVVVTFQRQAGHCHQSVIKINVLVTLWRHRFDCHTDVTTTLMSLWHRGDSRGPGRVVMTLWRRCRCNVTTTWISVTLSRHDNSSLQCHSDTFCRGDILVTGQSSLQCHHDIDLRRRILAPQKNDQSENLPCQAFRRQEYNHDWQ